MQKHVVSAGISALLVLGVVNAQAADNRKEIRIDIAPGGAVTLVNNNGSVTIHAGTGHQVIAAYTTHSAKVEIDQTATPDKRRVELRTHLLSDQHSADEDFKVEYDLTVPAGVSVSVNTATAPITVDGVSGDLTLSSDTGLIVVRNVVKNHLQVRGVTAPVNLNDVVNGQVDVTTTGGAVQMVNVWGEKVTVRTGSGNITYRGDCSGGGSYSLATHSGSIEMLLPESASIDLTARTVSGTVLNDFPLQAKIHPTFVPKSGSSFAGTSNSGLSSVELQTFSGKIRVKKQ